MLAAQAGRVSRKPTLPLEQATAALRCGDPGEAERTLRAWLAANPNDSAVLARLADLIASLGRREEAVLLLRRAAAAAPRDLSVRLALVRRLQEQQQAGAALDQLRQIPLEQRQGFEAAALEAALLGQLGRHEEEIAVYRRLVAGRRDDAPLWMSLGHALKYAGRADEAVECFRRAVEIRPAYGEGWWSLANVKTVRFDDRDLAVMRRAIKSATGSADALHLHFAVGKALEDRGRYAQAFRHYDAGNRIRARAFSPHQMSAGAFVSRAVETFDASLFERFAGCGHPSREPIFVVGLQRSGSTLVEQILATHSLIEGTAELTVMQQLWERLARDAAASGRSVFDTVGELAPEQLESLGAEYLDRARAFRSTDRPHFVDKLPANWMNLGLIRLILPNAKIIDARRHPMACGFSNFKQHYATGVAFAYSQESIGRFYADYLRLMRHFDRVQPGAVHRLVNERLIDDPEGEVRRLLDFVGVPFDPACLDFHQTRRAVRTPSAEQVRRPLNRDGLDAWRRFEPWLGPLKAALGPALEDWDK